MKCEKSQVETGLLAMACGNFGSKNRCVCTENPIPHVMVKTTKGLA